MLDIVLRNARVVDGTGNPWFLADVGIKDGVVVEVGRPRAKAREAVDVGGRVVSPGFIDGHCHSDLMLFESPESGIKLAQGVTTEVVGNCGMTPAPFSEENLDSLASYIEPVLGTTEREWNWDTVERYVQGLRATQPSENVATFVGHGTLRIAEMGFEDHAASEGELGRMKGALREALEAGAVGLSLGLMYTPGSYASREELTQLCSVLPDYDGLLATHIRGEGRTLVPSIEEVIRVAEESGCALQISHLKAAGKGNWGSVGRAMELIEDARTRGVDVACDVYPYTAGSTSMMTLLPPWVLEGGVSRTLGRLRDPADRRSIRDEVEREGEGWDNLLASTGWESVYVSSLGKGPDPNIEGRHLAQIADSMGKVPAECMMDLLLEQEGRVAMIFFLMAEDDVEGVIGWEHSLVASDSLHFQSERPHPRSYGTFPRVLAEYVRERGLLTLEGAVRKMTSFPARRFRLGRRGVVAPGYAADLVVFDPATVSDRATYEEPKRTPEGIHLVLVGGKRTFEAGAHLGARNGAVLQRGGEVP